MAGPSSTHSGWHVPIKGGNLEIVVNGTRELALSNTGIGPITNDGMALGTATLSYADLFLASGAVINFDNGNVTLTHSSNTLSITAPSIILIGATNISVSSGILSFDGAAGSDIRINEAGANVDIALEGENNTQLLSLDAGLDNIGLGTTPNANTFLHILPGQQNRALQTSVGWAINLPADTITSSNTDTDAIGAYVFIGTPTLAGASASYTATDSATFYVEGAPVAGSNGVLTNAPKGLWIDEGLVVFDGAGTPASVSGSTGTANNGSLTVTGGLGGDTTISSTGTGGVGGGYSFTAGAGGVAASATTASTGGAGGAYALTTGAGGASIVSGSGNDTGGAGGAIAFTTGAGGATTTSTGTNTGGASGAISLITGTGGASQDGTDTGGASGNIAITTGTGGASDTGGATGSITLTTGAAGSGGSPVVGPILMSPGTTERWRYTPNGVFTSISAAEPSNAATTDGAILATGGLAITDVANAWIDDATHGGGTVAHLIGNETITSSSDVRLKRNIVDTVVNATALLSKFRVIDHTWGENYVAHKAYNARGKWMGVIAQEAIDVAPWIINAPVTDGMNSKDCSACRAGEACSVHVNEDGSAQYWFVNYDYLMPTMIKGFQELDARVLGLEGFEERTQNGWLKEQFTELMESDPAFREWVAEKVAV